MINRKYLLLNSLFALNAISAGGFSCCKSDNVKRPNAHLDHLRKEQEKVRRDELVGLGEIAYCNLEKDALKQLDGTKITAEIEHKMLSDEERKFVPDVASLSKQKIYFSTPFADSGTVYVGSLFDNIQMGSVVKYFAGYDYGRDLFSVKFRSSDNNTVMKFIIYDASHSYQSTKSILKPEKIQDRGIQYNGIPVFGVLMDVVSSSKTVPSNFAKPDNDVLGGSQKGNYRLGQISSVTFLVPENANIMSFRDILNCMQGMVLFGSDYTVHKALEDKDIANSYKAIAYSKSFKIMFNKTSGESVQTRSICTFGTVKRVREVFTRSVINDDFSRKSYEARNAHEIFNRLVGTALENAVADKAKEQGLNPETASQRARNEREKNLKDHGLDPKTSSFIVRE